MSSDHTPLAMTTLRELWHNSETSENTPWALTTLHELSRHSWNLDNILDLINRTHWSNPATLLWIAWQCEWVGMTMHTTRLRDIKKRRKLCASSDFASSFCVSEPLRVLLHYRQSRASPESNTPCALVEKSADPSPTCVSMPMPWSSGSSNLDIDEYKLYIHEIT